MLTFHNLAHFYWEVVKKRYFYSQADCKGCPLFFICVLVCIWPVDYDYMGQIPQDWENEQNVAYIFYFLKLYCDKTVWFFEVFSTVLKRFCPLQSKTSFVLVLVNLFDFSKNIVFWNGFNTRKESFSFNYKNPHFFLTVYCCSVTKGSDSSKAEA